MEDRARGDGVERAQRAGLERLAAIRALRRAADRVLVHDHHGGSDGDVALESEGVTELVQRTPQELRARMRRRAPEIVEAAAPHPDRGVDEPRGDRGARRRLEDRGVDGAIRRGVGRVIAGHRLRILLEEADLDAAVRDRRPLEADSEAGSLPGADRAIESVGLFRRGVRRKAQRDRLVRRPATQEEHDLARGRQQVRRDVPQPVALDRRQGRVARLQAGQIPGRGDTAGQEPERKDGDPRRALALSEPRSRHYARRLAASSKSPSASRPSAAKRSSWV